MVSFVTILHVVICVMLVVIVLIQPSREGGGIGSSFGGGSSQTIFGSSGGANFFTKFTSGLATIFMITSLYITASKSGTKKSIFDTNPAAAEAVDAATKEAAKSAPAAPVTTEAPADKK
jgi:preprotein translocase subunit SecG